MPNIAEEYLEHCCNDVSVTQFHVNVNYIMNILHITGFLLNKQQY